MFQIKEMLNIQGFLLWLANYLIKYNMWIYK